MATLYSARLATLDAIVRDDGATLSCPIYRSGALVAPTQSGSTFRLLNPSKVEIVTGNVTVTGSVATFNVAAEDISDQPFGDGWLVEWNLIVSGDTHRFRQHAAIVYRALYPVVTDADLFALESALNPTPSGGAQPITRAADFQTKLDDTWRELMDRVVRRGRRPWLSMEPAAFRDVHRYMALGAIFEDLATRLNPAYAEKAQRYQRRAQSAWDDLQWLEATVDGSPTHTRTSGGGSFWLGGRR